MKRYQLGGDPYADYMRKTLGRDTPVPMRPADQIPSGSPSPIYTAPNRPTYGDYMTRRLRLGKPVESGILKKDFSVDPSRPVPGTGPGITMSNEKPATSTSSNADSGASAVSTMAPFISNIVNTFRRAPQPKMGKLNTYTPLTKVNLSGERNRVSNTFAAANKATERNVDGNTAEAVKAFNRGQEFSQISAVNEKEDNLNIGISNQQAVMDQNVSAANTALYNKYRDEQVGRDIADQREQSANVANAGDKMVMIGNEKSKERTELAKANVLATGLYGQSGVLDRARRKMKEAGLDDPLGKDYKDVMALGGMMKKMRKLNC